MLYFFDYFTDFWDGLHGDSPISPDKKDGENMKTAEQIISYLKAELAEAYELHEAARGKDAAQALAYIIKATTIQHLLENIEE